MNVESEIEIAEMFLLLYLNSETLGGELVSEKERGRQRRGWRGEKVK